MVTIREQARITQRSRDLPDIIGGEVKDASWLVHENVLEKIPKHSQLVPGPPPWQNIQGYYWRGYLKAAMRELWMGIPAGVASERDKEANRVTETINRYLRKTGNMLCIEHGLKSQLSLWWVRAEWSDDAPPVEEHHYQKPQPDTTRKMVKVTAEEAGEDRQPAPVELKFQCPYCGQRFASQVRKSAHIFSYAKHESLEDWVVRGLQGVPLPASPRDIHLHMKELGFSGSEKLTGSTLRELADNPKSDVVLSVIPGRERSRYALKSRASEVRPAADFAPYCREPNCGAGPFRHSDPRGHHEKKWHPESPNRVWRCFHKEGKRECGATFYDEPGLGIHLMRRHHISGHGNEQRQVLIAKAAEGAATHVPVIVASPWGSRPELGLMITGKPVPEPVQPAPVSVPAPAPAKGKNFLGGGTLTPAHLARSVEITQQDDLATGISAEPAPAPVPGSQRPSESLLAVAAAMAAQEDELVKLRNDNAQLREQVKQLRKLDQVAKLLKTIKDE